MTRATYLLSDCDYTTKTDVPLHLFVEKETDEPARDAKGHFIKHDHTRDVYRCVLEGDNRKILHEGPNEVPAVEVYEATVAHYEAVSP